MEDVYDNSMVRSSALKNVADPLAGAMRTSLVADAYEAIKSAIQAAEFAPGQQVSEQYLADRFGMSRTPIHEAALRLQEEGLARIIPKRGIEIRALAIDDIAEIYEVLIAIEAAAAERIAGFNGEVRLAIAERLAAETKDMDAALAVGDLRRWGEADDRFHTHLVEAAGNNRFARIIRTVREQSHRARMITLRLRTGLDLSSKDHRRIEASIMAGDTVGAHIAAAAHRQRARAELLPLISRIGLKHF